LADRSGDVLPPQLHRDQSAKRLGGRRPGFQALLCSSSLVPPGSKGLSKEYGLTARFAPIQFRREPLSRGMKPLRSVEEINAFGRGVSQHRLYLDPLPASGSCGSVSLLVPGFRRRCVCGVSGKRLAGRRIRGLIRVEDQFAIDDLVSRMERSYLAVCQTCPGQKLMH